MGKPQKHPLQSRITGEGTVRADQLLANPNNWRTHPREQRAALEGLLDTVGWVQRVMVNETTGHIVDGHLRAEVALARDEDVPVIYVRLTEQEESLVLATLDPIGGLAGADQAMLDQLLEDIQVDDAGLQALIDSLRSVEDHEPEKGQTEDDDTPEAQAATVSVEGDVWLLGRHRVMCGDSTSIDAVEALMDGSAVDMVFTDPPYNVAFNGRSGKHDVIANDDLGEDEFDRFIGKVLQVIKAVNAPNYYIWCNWKFYATLQRELEYKSCIVWAKNVFGMGTNYRHQHEFCLFNGRIDDHIKNESDLWQVKKDTNYVHPTQKPVELSVRALGNHRAAKNILDLFGGSGSTLIGCEKMGRRGLIMELDPKYVDVIVRRWQDFTGQVATRESDGVEFNSVTPVIRAQKVK